MAIAKCEEIEEAMAADDAREAERIIQEREDVIGGTMCPLCKLPLSKEEYRRDFFGKPMREERRNCHRHRLIHCEKVWKDEGYPNMHWDRLEAPALERSQLIEEVISGKDCPSRQHFAEVHRQRADRHVHSAENLPTPGYYGMKGFAILSDVIMGNFSNAFRQNLTRAPLMRARGVTNFLHYVVLPELSVIIIQEDMGVSSERAYQIREESMEVGEFFYGDADDDDWN